jgi:hypothetical protein
MNTLKRIAGTVLVLGAGITIYELAVQASLIGQTLPLLLILAAQLQVGNLTGALMCSWRALAIAPLTFVAGFLAAAQPQVHDLLPSISPSDGTAYVASLAGGSAALGLVFVLTLLCSLLALGTAIGTTRGIRASHARRLAATRSAHLPSVEYVMEELDHIEHMGASAATR